MKYNNEKIYHEDRYAESILNNYTLYERQELNGIGINGNFGIIVRPINTLTVGINFITPTVIGVTDDFKTSMRSIWNNSADEVFENEEGFTGDHFEETVVEPLTYSITTPMRLNFGASYFFNKNGFISADIEWMDYSKANIHSNETDFSIDNEEISSLYRSVLNYRIGGEYRANIFRFRAGLNVQGDPMTVSDNTDRSKYSYSAGLGIRKKIFYADMAYIYSTWKDIRAPYTIDPLQEIGSTPIAEIQNNQSQLVFSFGFMF
jgi:long-subunit fatty acid transport protein